MDNFTRTRTLPWRVNKCSALLLTLLLVSSANTAAAANTPDANTLLRHIDQLWRGETSQASLSMQINTRRYQRSMTLEAWSRGTEYSLVVIREPVKDRGIATLKVTRNIWNYLPKINRVTKIPASMMSGAWMGSHFTNDDLIKESSYAEDYDAQITFAGSRDGQQIYEISAVPKADAAVVWGKVVMQIEQATLSPLRARYYDEGGELMRTLSFDQRQVVGERTIPLRLTLQPEDKPDESTVIVYDSIRFGVPLEATFFSLQNLQRRR